MSEDEDVFDTPGTDPRSQILGPIFAAAWESECSGCDEPILPGEDARADGRGGWVHSDDRCQRVALS